MFTSDQLMCNLSRRFLSALCVPLLALQFLSTKPGQCKRQSKQHAPENSLHSANPPKQFARRPSSIDLGHDMRHTGNGRSKRHAQRWSAFYPRAGSSSLQGLHDFGRGSSLGSPALKDSKIRLHLDIARLRKFNSCQCQEGFPSIAREKRG